MANPFISLVSTYVASAETTQSQYITFSFANTSGFDCWVPVMVAYPNTTGISAGAEVYTFRSTDNGATYETVQNAATAFPLPTAALQVARRDINVGNGIFYVAVLTGGGNANVTYTVQLGTAYLVTAYA
jgi:hypothetical protein